MSHIYEPCHTYTSNVTHMKAMSPYMSHVTHVRVMSHIYKPCHTYMSHVTHVRVMSPI